MPSRNKNNKNRKNSNITGILTLIAWALFLTIIVNSMSTYLSSGNRTSSTVSAEITYSDFLDMVEKGEVKSVKFDDSVITITPVDDYVYTQEVKTNTLGASGSKTTTKTYTGSDVSLYTSIIENPELLSLLREHNVSFTKPYVAQMSPVLSFMVAYVLPIIIMVFLFTFLMRGIGGRMGGGMGGLGNVGKSNAKVYMEKSTGVTFADVAGQDEAKESLEEIIDFLHNPGKYTAIGAKLPRGALLVGSPGTGKTLLAKAVAGEAKVPFFSISGSDFVEMFVGVGASRVRDLFKEAAKVAPCIIFIDEIDTIGKSRDANRFGGNDEREQTLNQLLSELDGFDPSKGIIVLGATNRPEVLDKALLRPGRFDRRIIVDKPNLAGRLATLEVHTRNIHLSEDVDLDKIAQATAGCVGADLANLVNEAALRAVRHGRSAVNQNDLLESFETVIAGSEKKGTVITEQEKKIIAYHEVGHALVAARQKKAQPVQKITIVPHTQGALGYTMQLPEEEKFLMSKDDLLTEIRTLLAGRSAEEVVFNTRTSGAANDIERATDLTRKLVSMYGMSDKFGMVALSTVQSQYLEGSMGMTCAQETFAAVDREVMDIIEQCHKDAVKILEDNREMLDKVAQYLLKKETITGQQMMAILEGRDPEQCDYYGAKAEDDEKKPAKLIESSAGVEAQAKNVHMISERIAAPEPPEENAENAQPTETSQPAETPEGDADNNETVPPEDMEEK
ncbi:MAG: ATP-dependent zinc metalloprotease FtsH [Oscillospiraceae bacterium]|nr:ATP-dependent zinc metalloprotease FtsH [Oscillospiraceae bacterium]